ncbi:MAG TPA: TIGR02757 family protein [Myxococcota bacterium]|nr:TIGR02757 family protein [Myxococcota bacterium]HPV04847.1 TIGR02757 family protein [Myxococcota bacterium]
MRPDVTRLKPFLDAVYDRFHTEESLACDPLSFPRQYRDPIDREAAAVIASAFAFGRVAAFMPVIDKVLSRLGESPGQALAEGNRALFREVADGVIYRFATPPNVEALLSGTAALLRRDGSLEPSVMSGFAAGGTVNGLLSLADALRSSGDGDPGFLVPVGNPDSPMKRLCMLLRWMVRRDGIDLGIWNGLRPSDLLFPLDVHVFRISGLLGLGDAGQNNAPRMKDAIALTRQLAELDQEDPVRYDFALSHLGISGTCRGSAGPNCADCPLVTVCGARLACD